jgi:DNA-binding protein Fis
MPDSRSYAAKVAKSLVKARADLVHVLKEAELETTVLHDQGVPETQIAKLLGVDRMTVRKWLGKK